MWCETSCHTLETKVRNPPCSLGFLRGKQRVCYVCYDIVAVSPDGAPLRVLRKGFSLTLRPPFAVSAGCLPPSTPPTSRINPRALLSASLTWSSSLWRVTWLCVSSFLRTAESDLHSCYHTQTTPLWSWENTIHVHIHGHSKKPSWCWTTASGLWTVPVWCKMC